MIYTITAKTAKTKISTVVVGINEKTAKDMFISQLKSKGIKFENIIDYKIVPAN